jgi:hypothetical protein
MLIIVVLILLIILMTIKQIDTFTNNDDCIDEPLQPFQPYKININIPNNLQNNLQSNNLNNNILPYSNNMYTSISSNNKNCCLVEKKFINNKFVYDYNKLKDSDCDYNKYNIDNNKQLFIEGTNNWSNDYCKDSKENKQGFLLGSLEKRCFSKVALDFSLEKSKGSLSENEFSDNSASIFSLEKMLGSCRQNNHECIDFISKDYCESEKLNWSENTCQSQIPYNFIDKVKFSSNNKNTLNDNNDSTNDSFRLF